MNKLLIVILFVGIIMFIYNNKQKSNSLYMQPILDDLNPIIMSKVNNGKLNVWTFCQDEDYNFKMSWRQPIGKYNYKYPFQKLCIETMLKNLDNYDVNFIIINRKNAHLYVPHFPTKLKNSGYGYGDKPVNDLLGAYLLEKYGGLWLSPYTVCLNRDYKPLFNDCQNNEIVTFGTSPTMINADPYGGTKAINNLIIGGKKGCSCIIAYKNLLEQHLFGEQYDYLYNHVGIDSEPLGEAITYTKPIHKHYCSKVDGSYNINDRKIHIDAILGKMPLQFKDPTRMLFVSVPYQEWSTDTKYRWILNTPYDELLNSNIAIVNTIKSVL
jgi:hypothetical protein